MNWPYFRKSTLNECPWFAGGTSVAPPGTIKLASTGATVLLASTNAVVRLAGA